MEASQELETLRQQMDAINGRLATILHERAALAHRIGAIKRRHGLPLADPSRETQMQAQMRQLGAPNGVDPDAMARIFAAVLAESRAIVERG
ncbi:MAG: chorismate mutase [Planctomycetes bacterium]|nr:chorismate mutase [Planctomycetota bacterium]